MAIVVQKYGGSSVADADKISNVARRVAASFNKGNKVVVVVSA
ncbi:MAG: aspartate kinase, partial [Chloroflexi bacterium]|nr:aspartate kinase [Chloroflexota bacterium]